ncbi:MAG: UvrD-helicase domain-containing protein [Roseiflexaceae bacterium]|nr:UvrD-helicase domain-containing protein [Roseiflexaceae bacterium]
MADLLDNLNANQSIAVQAINGPVLVLAGPGSGKTRVLTHRVGFLIEQAGVDPYHILAVTFTNKAAREMRERLETLLGSGRAAALTVGTFHSICVRFLRRDIQHLGRERDFTIYDSDDQQRVMKRVLKSLDLDEKKNSPRAIHATISRAKNELVDVAEFKQHARSYFDEVVARCYERYQALLRESNALDFDDLMVETVRLFEQHPEVLQRYHQRYTYLLADEYQDTNRAQYKLLNLLATGYEAAPGNQNLFVVGDEDQCLPAGSLVQTPGGESSIEAIRAGDLVACGAGRGTTTQRVVQKTYARPYVGKLVHVTLTTGQQLQLTPNHMCFARLGLRTDIYHVYLMYRRDKGYRIGLTRGYRSEGQRNLTVHGLQVRVRQEHADKAWILRSCASREEAAFYEHFFAIEYGIPTMVFDVAGRGSISFSQETVDRLFASIDSRTHAMRLMEELGLYEDYPHYQPNGSSGGTRLDRMLVHLTVFGGNAPSIESPWFRHRVWLNTTDPIVEQQLVQQGIMTRAGKRDTWRIERSHTKLEQSAALAEQIAEAAGGLDVIRWAMLTTSEKFALQPAAHLRPAMIVPVWHDGRVVDAEIIAVEEHAYDGVVYDIDVADLHNYFANGIVVHNSIYAFRGADIRNIRSFEDDYPNAQVVVLNRNYRSTQAILDVAQAVINRSAQRRHPKQLETLNGQGTQVQLLEGYDQDEEAQLIAGEIARLVSAGNYQYGDIAVMYRTNAQSRAIEEALISRGLRYQIVGGIRFYERKEIKDALAYLRLALNPFDAVGLGRILNWPGRGIGEKTQDELERWASALHVPTYVALQMLDESGSALHATDTPPTFATRTKAALLGFLRLIDEIIGGRELYDLGDLIQLVLNRVGFQEALIREYGDDEGADRWNNVQELQNVALNYANLPREAQLPTFLEEVMLVSDIDQLNEERDTITCITLHQAKGLEYPVVFLTGLEEGLMPHARSTDDREALDEERRLFYVGATRAKERLYLLYAMRRATFGRTQQSQKSRFLADIPSELLKQSSKRGYSTPAEQSSMFTTRSTIGSSRVLPNRAQASSSGTQSRTEAPRASGPRAVAFFAGQRVRHALFGEGVVVSSRLIEDDEEVTIAFPGKGVKRLLASFAKLERAE